MPWYGSVLLAVIPAVATGLFAWLIARSQYRAAIERLEKELAHEKDKDQRQRMREVRSTPLLAFRRELANMAQKYIARIEDLQTQYTSHPPVRIELVQDALKAANDDWISYIASGNYQRAKFELDDQKIIDAAQDLWAQLSIAYFKISYVEIPDGQGVFNELRKIKKSITKIQRLINQRLQEL